MRILRIKSIQDLGFDSLDGAERLRRNICSPYSTVLPPVMTKQEEVFLDQGVSSFA